ncbi:anosmin-1-like isoform X2 [Orbicella faveolata]|uniref:anosmin-1-like isoform X2 n=1 Tax=Orbicella faveolata TaxID=48498 RepID=UPI0009E1E7C3|nr:anosmin-1-like isoform X2 [Orbicella faveolata]
MKHYFGLFFSILIGVCVFNENSATVLSARCKSRCLAKVTAVPECITQDCSACMKPCQDQEKKGILSCSILCGSGAHVKRRNICKDSCKFMKHLHLEDHGNSSCPTGVAESKCELMRPENVQVSPPKTKKESRKVTWNGTWPPETVFIIFERWHKKGMSAAQGTSQGWREFKQTILQSITVELQPLVWHQFKVLAANQYTTSSFSLPSKLEFAELRSPGPPREFRVLSMRTVKGHAEVDISWRKPESNNGLPIHKYKLSWSMRPDILLDQYESFEVSEQRIKGNIHQYSINGLQPNTTYLLEIQAILRLNTKRVRSSRVTLTVRTPALAKVSKKKTKVAKNSISSSTKSTNGKMAVVSKPTIQGPNSKSIYVSTPPSQASTPQRNGTESSNLKVQKSVAVLINVLGLHTDILIALVVIIMCYL